MNVRRVELTIEELVVEGVDVGDRGRFVASLEHELTRLFQRQRVPEAWGGGDPPEAPPHGAAPALPAQRSPEAWGCAVAERVHASVTAAEAPALERSGP